MSKTVTMIVAAMLFAGCTQDCTRETKDVPYCGDASAIDPYVEVDRLENMPGSCDGAGCTYFFTATAWLHNPRTESFTTNVACEFWDDNYLIETSVRANITIDARRSKELQFQEQYTTIDYTTVSTDCVLTPVL